MENTYFQQVQDNTLRCLNEIVVVNHQKNQDIKKWIEQAIMNARNECFVAKIENISDDQLSSVAKIVKLNLSQEETEKLIMNEAIKKLTPVNETIDVTSTFIFVDDDEAKRVSDGSKVDEGAGCGEGVDDVIDIFEKPKKPKTRRIPVLLDKFSIDGCEFTLTAKRPTMRGQKKSNTKNDEIER